MTVAELVVKIRADATELSKSNKKTEKELKSLQKSFSDFSQNAAKFGTNMNKYVTLPLIAAGAASLKFAADAEVSARKFNKAFGQDAASSIGELSDAIGISNSEASRLLANTGDLLKGFGATSSQALETSIRVQKLAAALAAYNGVPVAQASEAITKALVGETEGLKSLGIVVNQTTIEQELLRRGMKNLTGDSLLLAKSQITLDLAYGQSADAVSSFKDNQETLAFQTGKLIGEIKDLSVGLGNVLLPAAKDVVKAASGLVDWMQGLDDATKKNIVSTGLFVASIGPVLTTIPKAVNGIKALGTAVTALGAAGGPITLTIAAVGAFVVAIDKASRAWRSAEFDKLNAAMGGAAQSAGLTAEAFAEIQAQLVNSDQPMAVVEQRVRNIAQKYGVLTSAVIDATIAKQKELAKTLGSIYVENKALKALRDRVIQEEAAKKASQDRAAAGRAIAAAEAERAEKEKRAAEESRRIAEEKKKQVQDALALAKKEIDTLIENETRTAEFERRKIDNGKISNEIFQKYLKLLEMQDQFTPEMMKQVEAIRAMAESWRATDENLNSFQKQATKTTGEVDKLDDSLKATDESASHLVLDFTEGFEDATDAVEKVWGAVGDFSGSIEDAQKATISLAKDFSKLLMSSKNEGAAAAGAVLSITTTIFETIDKLANASKNRIKALGDLNRDIRSQTLQLAMDAVDAQLKAELKARGFVEKSDLRIAGERRKSLQDEIALLEQQMNEAFKNGDAELANIKRTEIAEKKADLDAARREEEKQKIIEKYQRKRQEFEIQLARVQRDIALAQARVDQQKAIAALGIFATEAQKSEVRALYQSLMEAIVRVPIPTLDSPTALVEQGGIMPGAGANVPQPPISIAPEPVLGPGYNEGTGGGGKLGPTPITVNIYSPTATTPSEAAAMFNQTARELAFVGVL